MRNSLVFCIGISALFLFSSSCFAHKINVFGYVEQGMVKTESMFSGGRVAQNCTLSIDSGSGTPVFIGKTDERGLLDFPVPGQVNGFDLLVVCGDGHRGTWRIEAEEFIETGATPSGDAPVPDAVSVSTTVPVTVPSDFRRILREELAAELGPVKRQLAKLRQDKISLADIMGGLGYFLGLAGLASYMRFRKCGK